MKEKKKLMGDGWVMGDHVVVQKCRSVACRSLRNEEEAEDNYE
jgi:hypothetical protein